MTTTDADRSELYAELPALEASNEALRAALESLLSPTVISALAAGGAPVAIDSADAERAAADASALLQRIDGQLPALRTTTHD